MEIPASILRNRWDRSNQAKSSHARIIRPYKSGKTTRADPSAKQKSNTIVLDMRRLEGTEIESYDVLSRELAERVLIVRVRLLPFGSNGMAIGRFVLLRTDNDRRGNRKLLAHELIHVRQWYEAGRWAFLRTYLGDYFRELRSRRCHRDAYLAIRAELQAQAEADAWESRNSLSL